MPYIKRQDRERLQDERASGTGVQIRTPGELNYLLTELAKEYVGQHGLSYATIGEVVSSFECAKLEFYRRIATPYENSKMAINGDVY